jgi:peroxiredoxin Q/BCP
MTHLSIGAQAPDFKGIDQNGKYISLSQFSGKKLILYFYPKDNTPGCTVEACNLRDNYNELIDKGYQIVGVSPDSEKSHLNFINKFSLPFPLIADTDKKLAIDYGVWGEKSMYGKKYFGIFRTTFIIDENGIIERIFDKVDTKNHSNQIVENKSSISF